MTKTERNAMLERCAIIAETLHGVDEGDTPQDVRAGHRIASEIRLLKTPYSKETPDGGSWENPSAVTGASPHEPS